MTQPVARVCIAVALAAGFFAFSEAEANAGICADDLYRPPYTECWGVVSNEECSTGIGHWYYDRSNGASYTWCYVGVPHTGAQAASQEGA